MGIKIDNELASRFLKGDRGAVGEVYLLTYRFLYFVSASILSNEEDAFDVVHELFLKSLSGFSLSKKESLVAYLSKTARNLSLNLLRKRKMEVEADPSLEIPWNGEPTPYLNAVLPGLSRKEAIVLALHLYFGYSFREISDFSSLPRSSLNDIYRSALAKARARLEKEHENANQKGN